MGIFVAVLAFGFAVVSTFGAWTVVRRKPRIASAFMLAAALLTIAGVGAIYYLPEAWWLALAGAAAASLASYAHARLVVQRVVVRNHLARLLFGAVLVALTWIAVR